MDPVTLILSALAAGAAAAAKDTTALAVKDAYYELKAVIKKRFSDKPAAELALDQYEAKPQVWEAPLKDGLAEAKIADDPAVIEAAQHLLTLVQPQQIARGKYNVQIANAKGTVIGDNASVTQHFGADDD